MEKDIHQDSRMGEFDFISGIRNQFGDISRFPRLAEISHGIGDDCAVIPQHGGYETVVSTDMLVEGSHFLRDDITPYQLGWKAAAVNFSDIAAMGAEPVGSLLAVALPKDLPDTWLSEFIRGYKTLSQRFDFPLIGGDTTASSGPISICVTVMGKCPAGRSLLRSAAKEGDLVCVTGTLGDSGLGLDAILRRMKGDEELPYSADILIERHYKPLPRINEGLVLTDTEGVHAMMDISDGVASDLLHILEESHCDAQVDLSLLPISSEAFAYCKRMRLIQEKYAICSGEDYELLFTISPEAEPGLDVPHTVIGRILPYQSGSIHWMNLPEGLSADELMGFRHF